MHIEDLRDSLLDAIDCIAQAEEYLSAHDDLEDFLDDLTCVKEKIAEQLEEYETILRIEHDHEMERLRIDSYNW